MSTFKKSKSGGSQVGITLSENLFALAVVRHAKAGKPSIDYCESHASGEASGPALKALLEKHGAARSPACAVVDSDDYQIVQVEAPEVLPSEMRDAIRWRLRDAISFNVDEAAVDVFEIPDQARHARSKMLFAVAARDSAVQRIAGALKPVAKGFCAIDIPELCLRNVSSLLPQDSKGVALLAISENFAQLVITRQGILYVTRRIDTQRRFNPHARDNDADFDAGTLALEVQRSLDYYESHYDQSAVGDLVIAPAGERCGRLADALRTETSLRISLLDVRELCNVYKSGELVTDWASLVALGAALRPDPTSM